MEYVCMQLYISTSLFDKPSRMINLYERYRLFEVDFAVSFIVLLFDDLVCIEHPVYSLNSFIMPLSVSTFRCFSYLTINVNICPERIAGVREFVMRGKER